MQVPDIQRIKSHIETAYMANIRERAHLADKLWAIARKLYICMDKDLPDIEARIYKVLTQLVANSKDAAEIKKLEKSDSNDPQILKGIADNLSTLVDEMPTRRDMLAGMAMQSLAEFTTNSTDLCELSVRYADDLIAQLDKKTSDFDFPIAKDASELPE